MQNIEEKKVKLESKPMENFVVKVADGKMVTDEQIIENYKMAKKGRCEYWHIEELVIKPYLSGEDIAIANKNCINQFLADNEQDGITRFEIFPNVKIVFDLVVAMQCTNLDIQATFEVYDNLVSSGLMDFIIGKIKNYESVWKIVLESIKLRNIFMGLNLIEERIPNAKDFDKNVSEMSTLVKEMNEKDPQLLRKIVETMSVKTAIEETKTEIAENKTKVKATSSSKKKD